MRIEVKHPSADDAKLARSKEGDERLIRFLQEELEDAIGQRYYLDRMLADCLRRYDAVPKNPTRNVPVENAPNIEVALGAIACDSIAAQMVDTIGSVSPIVTARAVSDDEDSQNDAAALQRRINHGVTSEWNFRPTMDAAVLDDVQLGTSVLYCPFTETKRKTAIDTVTDRGARMMAWPIEDVYVPGGEMADVQTARWIALRKWYRTTELTAEAKAGGWNLVGVKQTNIDSWVRRKRETLGEQPKSMSLRYGYELFHCWIHFDYDNDGIDEDLFVVYDRSGRVLCHVEYNPYDTRPLVAIRYQLRNYLFYGLGVLEMTKSNQETVSELMNQGLLNTQLANTGIVCVKEGTVSKDTKLWVGKIHETPDPVNDVVPKVLHKPAPETAQYIAINVGFAERRTGVNEMSMPRPSAILGSRTPGITAMTMAQSANRRFTPAYDALRMGLGEGVRHCLLREQERLLLGDQDLERHLMVILGAEDGTRVIRLLKDPDFDNAVTIELTASSASVNREADRQNALLLTQILGTYYERVLQLVQLAANPGLPEPIRDVARKIADAGGKIIERALTTFDTVRDPKTFIVDVDAELDQLTPQLDMQGLSGLAQLMQGTIGPSPLGPSGGGPGAPPAMPEAA